MMEKLTTLQARNYLIEFMEQHFIDKTFHQYIRGDYTRCLAADFAWQMATALKAQKNMMNQDEKLQALKEARNRAIAEAEKAAYAYFCECEVGQERIRAGDVYDNVRTAVRVGF